MIQAAPALRLVLVEDDEDDAELMRAMLNEGRLGATEVVRFGNLADAHAFLRTNDVDCVLLDLALPDSRGLDTLRETRALVPDVPVVVLTGLDSAALADQARGAGARDYLVKGGFDVDVLGRVLGEASERARARAALPAADAPGARPWRRLEQVLVDARHLRVQDVEALLAQQASGGGLLGDLAVRSGLVTEATLRDALAEQLGLMSLPDGELRPAPGVLAGLDLEMLKRRAALPLRRLDNGTVLVAMAEPTNVTTIDDLAVLLGSPVTRAVARGTAILEVLAGTSGDMSVHTLDDEPALESDAALFAADSPAVRLLDEVLEAAVASGASDVHIYPRERAYVIVQRIDGELTPLTTVPTGLGAALLGRLKVIAGLDIAERRRPADGRIRVKAGGRTLDLRVATIGVSGGERATIRVLDVDAPTRPLSGLGFSNAQLTAVTRALDDPQGLIVVAGPTGAGKTTTLYSLLRAMLRPGLHAMTIEDPIEYSIPDVSQIQVNVRAGIDFASALRAALRHDPDIVLVGEVRDRETAQIAMQAALTGHRVLATTHALDATATVERLLSFGIEEELFGQVCRLIVAQRLLRTTCTRCRGGNAANCHVCAGRGLMGRRAVAEIFDPATATMHVGADGRRTCDLVDGWSMRTAALALATAGDTTRAEAVAATPDPDARKRLAS